MIHNKIYHVRNTKTIIIRSMLAKEEVRKKKDDSVAFILKNLIVQSFKHLGKYNLCLIAGEKLLTKKIKIISTKKDFKRCALKFFLSKILFFFWQN